MEALRIVRNDGEPGTVVRRTAVAGEGAQLVVAFADGSRVVVPESALEDLRRAKSNLRLTAPSADEQVFEVAEEVMDVRGVRSAA